MPKIQKTQRGFSYLKFLDTNSHECSIQDSSTVMKRCIWLGLNNVVPVQGEYLGRMHLSRKEVKMLLPILQRFVDTGTIAEPKIEKEKPIPPRTLQDLLMLVSVEVPLKDIQKWSIEQRMQAADWAGTEHLHASDNPVKRLPKPKFLQKKEYDHKPVYDGIWPKGMTDEHNKQLDREVARNLRRAKSGSSKVR